jgi:poly-gamma-glutamate capsule biosynthesis protein CapA/YwtB (metallophosphatase superfamily)
MLLLTLQKKLAKVKLGLYTKQASK